MVKKISKKYVNKNIEEHENFLNNKIEKEKGKENENETLNFEINKKPSKKVRKELDKDRFKKKVKTISPKFEKKLNNINKNKVEIKIEENDKEDIVNDIWDDNNNKKNSKGKLIMNKKIKKLNNQNIDNKKKEYLIPHEGQSYNPKINSHKDLLDKIIEHDYLNKNYEKIKKNIQIDLKERVHKTYEKKFLDKEIKLKKEIKNLNLMLKKKNIKTKEINDIKTKIQLKEIKLEKVSHNNLKKFIKNLDEKYKVNNENNEIKNKMKEEIIEKINKGEIYSTKDRKVMYNIPEIKPLQDLPNNLKNIEGNENFINNHYENLFKLGILDRPNNKKHRKKFLKKKLKAHNLHTTGNNKEINDIKIINK